MRRTTILMFAFGFLCAVPSYGQVSLAVSRGDHRVHQYMTGLIKNRGLQPITICIAQEINHREDKQAQPFALTVERMEFGQWTPVLSSKGISGHTQVIEPGVNLEFQFTVDRVGQYRLVAQYTPGSNPSSSCTILSDSTAIASKPFSVRD